jgi:hypothetical protein
LMLASFLSGWLVWRTWRGPVCTLFDTTAAGRNDRARACPDWSYSWKPTKAVSPVCFLHPQISLIHGFPSRGLPAAEMLRALASAAAQGQGVVNATSASPAATDAPSRLNVGLIAGVVTAAVVVALLVSLAVAIFFWRRGTSREVCTVPSFPHVLIPCCAGFDGTFQAAM